MFFLRETASPSDTERILGAWSLAAHDVDRAVSTTALKAWKDTILSPSEESAGEILVLDDNSLSSIGMFVQRTALDPSGIYAYLNPLPPIAPAPPAKKGQSGGKLATSRKEDIAQTPRSKTDEQEESEQDRNARLRISALGTMRWIYSMSYFPLHKIKVLHTLDTTSSLSEDLVAFFSNPALWTALNTNELCPWITGFESFGFAQPNVRKAAWGLVQTLLNTQKGPLNLEHPQYSQGLFACPLGQLETIISILSIAVLRSAWVELDSTVQVVMWQPLLMFLKRMHFTFAHRFTSNFSKLARISPVMDNRRYKERWRGRR